MEAFDLVARKAGTAGRGSALLPHWSSPPPYQPRGRVDRLFPAQARDVNLVTGTPDRPTRPQSATIDDPVDPSRRLNLVETTLRRRRHPGVRAPRHCAAVQDSPSVSLRPAISRNSGSGQISVAAPETRGSWSSTSREQTTHP